MEIMRPTQNKIDIIEEDFKTLGVNNWRKIIQDRNKCVIL